MRTTRTLERPLPQEIQVTKMLKLMFITNDPVIALGAENAGVDRIFVDLESVGKAERQGGMDTVQSKHTVADVAAMRKLLTKSELFVRVNQIYEGSEAEINAVIEAGADVVMLPYFKTAAQVKKFIDCVKGRAKTCLLFETPEAVACVDEILAIDGIDECYVGLNDLHLGYGRKFMFELVADGTTDYLCYKFAQAGIPYGFGGIARIGTGMLSADVIMGEHVRLGSSIVILSRGFCDVRTIPAEECGAVFAEEVPKMRAKEIELQGKDEIFLAENHAELQRIVAQIVESKS